ncbi:hypothetical protein WI29_06575 [Burkholderia ubonensis]|nr:hypothetical protein WI31_32155 [Burkholderia ubonensis]KUZ16248.1 hypothetical protein WI29_06575 [Burkholderia ubonensis]KUZ26582.1 hypothetical protein WI32_31310 [Burkholderia ubonensis]KUZ29942.1 hypothetical protein WI30_20765 [Burkholderia ubonensis]KUZ44644.1 hypothetical protein WI33_02045 [Burkholderia ubonensis]
MPPSGRSTPLRILTKVDLPAPFSPISATTSPASIDRFDADSATVASKRFAMPAALRTGGDADRCDRPARIAPAISFAVAVMPAPLSGMARLQPEQHVAGHVTHLPR